MYACGLASFLTTNIVAITLQLYMIKKYDFYLMLVIRSKHDTNETFKIFLHNK